MHQVFRFSFSVSIYEKYFCCNVEIACFILSYYCNLLEFPLVFNSNQWMYMNSCYVLCYRPILLKPTAYWSHLRNSKILIPGLSPRYSDLLGLRHRFCLSVCCFMLFWWFYCKARHVNNFSRAIKLNKARFLCLRNSKKKVLSDRCGKMICWCSIIELCSRRTWPGSSENLLKKVELELISNKSKDFLPAQSKEEPLGKGKKWSKTQQLKSSNVFEEYQ